MAKILMHVVGTDGQIDLLEDRVVIRRDGILNVFKHGLNSKREIPFAAISEVMFKDANMFRMGEIEFVRGGRSTDERKKKTDGIVRFRKKEQDQFEMLKEKVFEMMASAQRR